MKRHVQYPGVRKWSGNDLLELQGEGLSIADKFFSQFGNCVITGCTVAENNVSAGLVSIAGMIMPFEGITAEVFPVYLVKDEEHLEREYADDVVRDIAVRYFAKAVYLQPQGEYITITAEGAKFFFDNIKPEWLDDSLKDINKQVDDLLKTDADLMPAVELLLQITNNLEVFDTEADARLTRLETLLNYIPTLENEPTDTTLTYQAGEITYEFQIGQQCRVYDAENETYVFYQLFNITEDNKAVWKNTVDEVNDVEAFNSLPVNTILETVPGAGNVFGEKWLPCDGSIVDALDYPDIKMNGVPKSTSTWKTNATGATIANATGVKVVFGNGVFVAVGVRMFRWSENGKDWTACTGIPVVTSSDYLTLHFLNGEFIICRDGKTPFYVSADGKNFTTRAQTGLPQNSRYKLSYGNGVYVCAVLPYSYVSIYYSYDCKTWVQSTVISAVESTNICSLIFAGGRFCVFFTIFSPATNDTLALAMYSSIDGIAWAGQYAEFDANVNHITFVNNILYKDECFFTIEQRCYESYMIWRIAISNDGINWTYYENPYGYGKQIYGLYKLDNYILGISLAESNIIDFHAFIEMDNAFFKGFLSAVSVKPTFSVVDMAIGNNVIVVLPSNNASNIRIYYADDLEIRLPYAENKYIKVLE